MYPYEEIVKPGKTEYLVQLSYFAIFFLIFFYIFKEIVGLLVVIAGIWLLGMIVTSQKKTKVEILGDELVVTGKKLEERAKVKEIAEVSKCFFLKSKYSASAHPYKRQTPSQITRMRLQHYPGVFRGIIIRFQDGRQIAVPTHQPSELISALGLPQADY
ncbi:hypothetical protein KJ758_01155 [Patescibacteria group bacterium]|nr:hypothetical protein [Patescibacteria group bacterium]